MAGTHDPRGGTTRPEAEQRTAQRAVRLAGPSRPAAGPDAAPSAPNTGHQAGVSDAARLTDTLTKRIGADRYARYFVDGARLDVDGSRVAVRVRDAFTAELIERRFGAELRDAAAVAFGPGRAVRLEIDPGLEPGADHDPAGSGDDADAAPHAAARPRALPGRSRSPAAAQDRPGRAAGARSSGGAQPAHRAWETGQTFETFVIGPCNRVAAAAGRRVAESADNDFGTLFVHAGCGMGKTHLLRAIAARFCQVRPGARVLFITGEQFVGSFVAAVKSGSTTAFQKRHRELDLLVIDDVHAVGNKQKTQVELTHTLSALRDARARVVLASDCQPRSIAQISEALATRLGQGLVARIDPPDEEVRRTLITKLLSRRSVPMTPSGVERVVAATAGAESVRELEGVAAQIEAVWRVDGALGEVGAVLVDRALAVRGPARGTPSAHRNPGQPGSSEAALPTGPVPMERIIGAVCERCGVQPGELGNNGRTRRVVLARSLVVLLARKMTNLSYPEIARGIGRPNHSTVITQIRALEDRIARGESVAVGCVLDGRKIDDAAGYLERVIRSGGEPLPG
jgi:chromosomal replication initiator protein